jgi:hypothetical protein
MSALSWVHGIGEAEDVRGGYSEAAITEIFGNFPGQREAGGRGGVVAGGTIVRYR